MSICIFSSYEGCKILKREHCRGCTFKKTQEQLDKGRKKARKRIDSLPMIKRLYINEKYYNRGLKYGKDRGII